MGLTVRRTQHERGLLSGCARTGQRGESNPSARMTMLGRFGIASILAHVA